ncbi:MAG: DNA/RNA non-specific endonuclease [Phycisphaerales bacterium JB038]
MLIREGFVIGHYDLFKVPAWVSARWTREDCDRLQSGSFGRPFAPDDELPPYGRAETSYDFSASAMERGHMARHEDNEAWGNDNSDLGCRMSNIIPQHKDMNGEAWNDLEELHQEVVTDLNVNIDTVWVISGPVFENGHPEFTVRNGVAVPMGTYKVISWFDGAGDFQARGYIVKQDDRVRNDPSHYLVRIRDIEQQTGLNFFPELHASRADTIETVLPMDLWGINGRGGGDAGPVAIHIQSLLPNPTGNESQDEAATIRNSGSAQVSLDGWLLRDAARRTWSLFGTIDAGDERTFLRSGQAMALNNSGPETVELVGPDGAVVDSVSYDGAPEGHVMLADSLR